MWRNGKNIIARAGQKADQRDIQERGHELTARFERIDHKADQQRKNHPAQERLHFFSGGKFAAQIRRDERVAPLKDHGGDEALQK